MKTPVSTTTTRMSFGSRPRIGNARGPIVDIRNDAIATTSSVTEAEVCDLIEAAGPLGLRDIAGGLDASIRAVAARVRRMLRNGTLKQDEWARYRLWGECRG
jgi:hypothetical protein